jgi:hypothetical protein
MYLADCFRRRLAYGGTARGANMAQYYFHIRAGIDRIVDDEGMDFGDVADAHAEMRASAADLAAAAIRSGLGVDTRSLELEDEDGRILDIMPIRNILH